MTLTLDEVNRIRFPMARRPGEGYRAGEVDDFVDNVVTTFTAMNAETDRLKAQLEALKGDPGAGGGSSADAGKAALVQENEQLRAEVEKLRAAASAPTEQAGGASAAEIDELRRSNAALEERAARAEAALQQQGSAPAASFAGPSSGEPRVEKIVVTTSDEASSSAIRLVALATQQAESAITGAEEEAAEVKAAAEKAAAEATAAAEAKAQEIRTAAQTEAERLRSEAQQRAEKVDTDAKARRVELFATLEAEREEFAGKIDALKSWESNYRTSIAGFLKQEVEKVEKGNLTPDNMPKLAGEDRGNSATPRLDALLATKSEGAESASQPAEDGNR